ncbi:MAG: SUMF1/EgtB/PvdO family nonheme iron enzyme [Bacteroidales bacterium]|jgi:formylglycine-generating enzyme required for sulfatase activity|nr:SUMF1/EgtB/PvdO family nonheme iron enzyme [Bacteroidales bacterium]
MKKTLIILMAAAVIIAPGCGNRDGNSRNNNGEPADPLAGIPEVEGMAIVPGGKFPAVIDLDTLPVEIETFYLDKYEVTIKQFAEFVKATGYVPQTDQPEAQTWVLTSSKIELRSGVNWECDERGFPRVPGELDYPVVHVSCEDAEAYAVWAGKRLPTIYEWIYAATKGVENRNPLQYVMTGAWHSMNTRGIMKPGQKEPNDLGIYDIFGNVSEIVSTEGYTFSNLQGDLKPEDAARAAYSSFFGDPDNLWPVAFTIGHRKNTFFEKGFRCAMDLKKE